jgi:transcription termination/antitermination protein NusG
MADGIKENIHDIHKVDDNDDDSVNQDSFEKDTTTNFHTTEGSSSSQVSSNNNATTAPSSQNTSQQQESSTIQRSAPDSKFFAVRTSGGQEHVVANILQNKVNTKKIRICSILVLDSFKGYIIVEAPDSNVAYEALSGIRHVRGQIRGELPFKDIERYLVKKPVVSDLNVDDTVEVIAGPFKSMKAKITRVDYEKQEATVVLLDSPYQIPVTVDANYLKKLMH